MDVFLPFFKNNAFVLKVIKWALNVLNAFRAHRGVYPGGFTALEAKRAPPAFKQPFFCLWIL
jgi:hypothetical protein